MKNQFRVVDDAAWVELTLGFETCIDIEDLSKMAPHRWCVTVSKTGKVYAVTNLSTLDGTRRGALLFLHKHLLDVEGQVDHKNGDTLFNRRFNLRPATNQQNQFNRKKSPGRSSRFKGVSWNKRSGQWHAYIRLSGKRKHLGFFDDEERAARAYDTAAVEMFGEFARPNLTEKESPSTLNC